MKFKVLEGRTKKGQLSYLKSSHSCSCVGAGVGVGDSWGSLPTQGIPRSCSCGRIVQLGKDWLVFVFPAGVSSGLGVWERFCLWIHESSCSWIDPYLILTLQWQGSTNYQQFFAKTPSNGEIGALLFGQHLSRFLLSWGKPQFLD